VAYVKFSEINGVMYYRHVQLNRLSNSAMSIHSTLRLPLIGPNNLTSISRPNWRHLVPTVSAGFDLESYIC